MRPTSVPFLAGLVALTVRADPTWPASTDDLEEIMYQLQGTGARLFSDVISPCTNEASGPGRQNAAEWLRVGFHDMATANTYFGTGGLDGSLQFELTNTENTGPGHATTLKFLGNYVSSRTSLADLIAAAVYASVRSCGGPVVPVRAGRQDATEAGNPGVPQPQNSIGIFTDQFDRMGFSVPEMIQVLACGHTLGGVHSPEFPDLVPANSAPDDEAALDTSVAVFDNKVVTEYLAGTTKNPLVVGPSARIGKNSDFKVFNADANATMATLADPATFMNTCKTVLQKMIDTVPSGVVLTADPVTPYAVKPVDLQLTLNPDGQTLLLSGYIRVRTTNLPASSISSLTLTYKDRNGGNDCGSCATTATVQGSAAGFDDTFAFFPIAANIDTSTGISSFTVALHLSDSTTQIYDNNGHSYPITDAVLLQTPQSCLLQGTGALTVSALVRNDRTSLPVTLGVTYPVPRNTPDQNPVPALQNATVSMTKGKCVGDYTFYTGTYTIPGGLSFNARVDVISGDGDDVQVDDFNDAGKLAGTCRDYTGVASCSGAGPTSGEPSSSPTGTPTTTPTPTDTPTSATSATPTATLSHREIIGGYTLVSCWTEGANVRALRGASFAYDGMTLESCMGNCSGFAYWGAEYGRECYCGNSLDASSAEAPLSECDMVCSGDATEYCGAGNRLELYSTTATQSPTPTPTATLAVKPTVGAYSFVGCITEGVGIRALSEDSYAADDMTLESCAAFCSDFTYFGTEYGRECYCGDAVDASSDSAPLSDCSMVCAGDQFEYCGNGNRLELYKRSDASSPTGASTTGPSTTPSPTGPPPESSTPTTTPPPTSTASPAHKPTVSPYTLVGCWTEGNGVRALSADSYASGTGMTLESCAAFCSGHKYFGTEYGGECYCGNDLDSSSGPAPLEDCSMPCTGDALEYCGAGSRLELYADGAVIVSGPPTQPQTVTATDGSSTVTWTFENCYTEAAGGARALGGASQAGDEVTLESCAAFCAAYAYFGAEYGRECYCGDTFAAGSVVADEGDCSMPCVGNGSEFCGAGNRLSVYSKLE